MRTNLWVLGLQVVTNCFSISRDPGRTQLLRPLAPVSGNPQESLSSMGLRAVSFSSFPGDTPVSQMQESIPIILALHRCRVLLGRECVRLCQGEPSGRCQRDMQGKPASRVPDTPLSLRRELEGPCGSCQLSDGLIGLMNVLEKHSRWESQKGCGSSSAWHRGNTVFIL